MRHVKDFVAELSSMNCEDSPQYWRACLELAELDKDEDEAKRALERLGLVDKVRKTFYDMKLRTLSQETVAM